MTGWRAMLFFDGSADICRADVIDFSDIGASLALPAVSGFIGKGAVLTVHFEAQQRRFCRLANVRWAQADEAGTRFGVEFLDHAALDPQTHVLDLSSLRIDPSCALKLPANLALRQKALPFAELNGLVHVVCEDNDNGSLSLLLERLFKKNVQLWRCDLAQLEGRLKQVYGDNREDAFISLIRHEAKA